MTKLLRVSLQVRSLSVAQWLRKPVKQEGEQPLSTPMGESFWFGKVSYEPIVGSDDFMIHGVIRETDQQEFITAVRAIAKDDLLPGKAIDFSPIQRVNI